MTEQLAVELTEEMARKAGWDRFLDAYSTYLKEPSLSNAAKLKLAGCDLQLVDKRFSMEEFKTRLGWVEVEC